MGVRQRCSHLPLLFNTVWDVPVVQQAQFGNEGIKLLLVTDNIIVYVENPKRSTEKLLETLEKLPEIISLKQSHRNKTKMPKMKYFMY